MAPSVVKSKKRTTNKTPALTSCLLFPNQCWHPDVLKQRLPASVKDIIIYEHPVFFGTIPGYRQLRFNRLKLIYQLAVVRYYGDLLRSRGYTVRLTAPPRNAQLYYFDPVDKHIESDLKRRLHASSIQLDSPGFINTPADLATYHKSKPNPDSYMHAPFYKWMRTHQTDILPGTKTYDTLNRNKMPASTKVPPLPDPKNPVRFIDEAIRLVKGHATWKSWPGPCDSASLKFPITHEGAEHALAEFCKSRFRQFGVYQDAIDGQGRNFLFHSCISPMLNCGLLTPAQVLDAIRPYKTRVPKPAYEGFIRQVIGWREYQRYIYVYAADKMRNSNHFGNKEHLAPVWYTADAKTGIPPLDDAIRMAWNDGYLHHILRLMVVGNLMNLAGVHPHEVYAWFMEFSLDSYDWVMVGNVYSMALWADGGLTMRKPYISSSSYILNMSTYPRGDWTQTWDDLFHLFIDRNDESLTHTYYAGLVKAWRRNPEKAAILKRAREAVKKLVRT